MCTLWKSSHQLRLAPGGVAAETGQISAGMQIIAINGRDCAKALKAEVVHFMKTSDQVELVLAPAIRVPHHNSETGTNVTSPSRSASQHSGHANTGVHLERDRRPVQAPSVEVLRTLLNGTLSDESQQINVLSCP